MAGSNPFDIVSRLFELAVWPFEAAAKYSAEQQPLHERQLLVILLYPAMLLAMPLCLAICVAVMAYVFLIMPVVTICQGIARLFAR